MLLKDTCERRIAWYFITGSRREKEQFVMVLNYWTCSKQGKIQLRIRIQG